MPRLKLHGHSPYFKITRHDHQANTILGSGCSTPRRRFCCENVYCKHNKEPEPEPTAVPTPEPESEATPQPEPSNTTSEIQECEPQDKDAVATNEEKCDSIVEESGSTDESNVTTVESSESTSKDELDNTLGDIEPKTEGSESKEIGDEEEVQAEVNTHIDETEPEVELDKKGGEEGLRDGENTQEDDKVVEGIEDESATCVPGALEAPVDSIGTSTCLFLCVLFSLCDQLVFYELPRHEFV
jgi:hypothetical protein